MTKKAKHIEIDSEVAFNELPSLPPARDKIETVKILRQLVKSSVALAELKGLAKILPNPSAAIPTVPVPP